MWRALPPPPPSPSPPQFSTESDLMKNDLFENLVIPAIASSFGVILASVVAVGHIQISDRQQLKCFIAFQTTSAMVNSLVVLAICATNFHLFTIHFAPLQLVAFVSTVVALFLVCFPFRANRLLVTTEICLLLLAFLTTIISGCVAAPLSKKVENGNLFLTIVFVEACHAVHASTSLFLLLHTL